MEGQVIGGRYRLLRLIGRGGMGSVWLAEHLTLKNAVAIKLIDSELGKVGQGRARFLREAQLAARIKSTHVVQTYDYGLGDDNQPFIAMEYLVGESLRERIAARGRLTPAETARVLSHVARALTRAHEASLIHRDLKPENIFIAREADDEVIKILDFGVAKAADALSDSSIDPTRTGALCGTPFYMSPEQAQGLKTVDSRTDLWALGVVAFECLTGTLPFFASALGPLVVKIMSGPIPVPSTAVPEARLSPEIDAWMVHALAREPDRRFSTARELADSFLIASGSTESLPRSDRPEPTVGAIAAKVSVMPADPLSATVLDPSASGSKDLPAPGEPSSSPSRVPWIVAVALLSTVVAVLGVMLAMR